MNAEKSFTVNFGSGTVGMSNFGYFEESIFENTFNSLSDEERKALVDNEEAMRKYIDTLDEVYQNCDDEAYATLPLSAEEKKLVAEHLRAAIIERMEETEIMLRATTAENSTYDGSIKFTQGTLTIVRHIGTDYDDYEISRADEEVAAIYLISGIEAEGVDAECRDMMGFVTASTEDKLPEQMMIKDGWGEGRDRLVDVRHLPVGSWAFSAVLTDLLDANSRGKALITCRVEGNILIAD